MEKNIKELKEEYKKALEKATTEEEKEKITNDYERTKSLLELTNKMINEAEEDNKKFHKTLDKMSKVYNKLPDEPDITIDDIKKQGKQFTEEMYKMDQESKELDKQIANIDKQLDDLEKNKEEN